MKYINKTPTPKEVFRKNCGIGDSDLTLCGDADNITVNEILRYDESAGSVNCPAQKGHIQQIQPENSDRYQVFTSSSGDIYKRISIQDGPWSGWIKIPSLYEAPITTHHDTTGYDSAHILIAELRGLVANQRLRFEFTSGGVLGYGALPGLPSDDQDTVGHSTLDLTVGNGVDVRNLLGHFIYSNDSDASGNTSNVNGILLNKIGPYDYDIWVELKQFSSLTSVLFGDRLDKVTLISGVSQGSAPTGNLFGVSIRKNLHSGNLILENIPNLNADKITSGVFSSSRIPNYISVSSGAIAAATGDDFTSGTIYWRKMGKLVILQWDNLSVDGWLIDPGSHFIPSGIRPLVTVQNKITVDQSVIVSGTGYMYFRRYNTNNIIITQDHAALGSITYLTF